MNTLSNPLPMRAVVEASPGQPMRRWIALWGAMLGAFMAVLDIQITNASLADILGALGATFDEGSWIQTSYLVAEIVVIPLTAWLAGVVGTRRYLLGNASLFLVFSVACAFAGNLPILIVLRILQGFTGGVLIPMAFALVLRLLGPEERPVGYALFGITATFAPAVGPTLGGWLTTTLGWPAIFYLNLVPGLVMLGAIAWGLDDEAPRWRLLAEGDWAGIGAMAVGLGSLIVFLEEGNRNDWLGSRLIIGLGVMAVVFLAAFVVIELRVRDPFIHLRLLADRNFAAGSMINVVFGLAMYGTTYLLPMYLAQVQGYNAEQIGLTILWSGAPQLVTMAVAAALLKRIDARVLLSGGLLAFGGSCLLNAGLTNLTAHDQLRASQIVRAVGMPFILVPLTSLAMGNIGQRQSASASALFNMLRNLGGSIGIALLATQVDVREKFHSERLGEPVSPFNPATTERLEQLAGHWVSRGSDAATAAGQALATVAKSVRREAVVMAYGDAFLIVGVVMLAMVVAAWACRPVKGEAMSG